MSMLGGWWSGRLHIKIIISSTCCPTAWRRKGVFLFFISGCWHMIIRNRKRFTFSLVKGNQKQRRYLIEILLQRSLKVHAIYFSTLYSNVSVTWSVNNLLSESDILFFNQIQIDYKLKLKIYECINLVVLIWSIWSSILPT